jgi:hypothetical protein
VERFFVFLGIVLLGYALDGRGFAYLGYPPLFIGEVTLLVGLLVAAQTRGWLRLGQMPEALLLGALLAWGACRLLPDLPRHGLDTVRDGMVFGYSAFAVLIAVLILDKPQRLVMVLVHYRTFTRVFLALVLVVNALYRLVWLERPTWPWAPAVPIIHQKEGDIDVHLAAVLAFFVAGFAGPIRWRWIIPLGLTAAVMGSTDRAGMLALLAVVGICVAYRPRHSAPWRLVGMLLAAVGVLWISGLRFEVPGGKGREIAFDQIVDNFRSMAGGDSGRGLLDATKQWRQDWWSEIVNYTVHGPYTWTGKGFGINLADDDGFQVYDEAPLRSPHNVHLTFLARGGVPGLLAWAMAQLGWAACILYAWSRAHRARDRAWSGLFMFLFCFWTACIINATFDVFLEGPMGGIWFWCIYGLGLASLWIHRRCPQVLDPLR